MSDTLTQGQGSESTPINEAARLDKVVGGLEEAQAAEATAQQAAETPAVEVTEPTTVDLEAQLAQPAVEDEARDPQPAPVNPANVLDLKRAESATKQAQATEARQAVLKAEEAAGTLVYTEGQTPKPTTIDHPAPTENAAGEPVVEIKPEKKQSIWGRIFGSKEK